jgi:hypothetical protein
MCTLRETVLYTIKHGSQLYKMALLTTWCAIADFAVAGGCLRLTACRSRSGRWQHQHAPTSIVHTVVRAQGVVYDPQGHRQLQ